jgi:glutamate dehydrogenase (NAD(P)+)
MVQIIEYLDPVEHCSGFLVYDGTNCRLAAGGCRMHAGLTVDELQHLASCMTLKQRVLGINVDGAKCGVAYDPGGPGRLAVLQRFVGFLKDELSTRFSMGCDIGTRFEELDLIAADLGIGSAKYAVKVAQRLDDEDFDARIRLLDAKVGVLTLGQRRAGHALAHAALAAVGFAGSGRTKPDFALQGFGNLGRAAAEALVQQGAKITAIADEHGCVVNPHGLDVEHMLSLDQRRPVPGLLGDPLRLPKEALFNLPVDVLILAGVDDALTAEQAALLPASIVVVGANRGLHEDAERLLDDRGVVVIPDFVGGIGGSASMEALFGPTRTPSPHEVLTTIAGMMREIVEDICVGARDRGVSTQQVARDIAAAAVVSPDERPYGSSPYRLSRPSPRGLRMIKHPGPAAKPPTGDTGGRFERETR